MGLTAVLVRWVPPLHPRRGLGWFVPRAGGHQNRSVWQEQAKPGHGSVLTAGGGSGSFAIPVPGVGAREVPDTAHPGHCPSRTRRGSPGQCPGNSAAHVLGSVTCSLISVIPFERELPKPRHFQDILVSVLKGE